MSHKPQRSDSRLTREGDCSNTGTSGESWEGGKRQGVGQGLEVPPGPCHLSPCLGGLVSLRPGKPAAFLALARMSCSRRTRESGWAAAGACFLPAARGRMAANCFLGLSGAKEAAKVTYGAHLCTVRESAEKCAEGGLGGD